MNEPEHISVAIGELLGELCLKNGRDEPSATTGPELVRDELRKAVGK